MLTDLAVEEGVTVDLVCGARDVKDVFGLFELLAELAFDSRAAVLRELDALEIHQVRLLELLSQKTTDAVVDLRVAARGQP
ncbi:MAG: hypothetical protein JRH14_21160 [Deltaproteobacteria bacterium]|nr:hypothetical protein [Deltaproteobacteria bacterium]